MRNTFGFVILALSLLIVAGEALPASPGESIRRKLFYTEKDFGELGWLHRARGEKNANYQNWITYFDPKNEICLPDSNGTYWLQLNHRDEGRAREVDAFLVSILYHRSNPNGFEIDADLQLYRNNNWYVLDINGNRRAASALGKFEKEPAELAFLGLPKFMELNSSSNIQSDERIKILRNKIGDFHARIAADAKSPSSWEVRGVLSERVSNLIDKTVFRYAARLYRFTTTKKINSNIPVTVELNRHGAESVDLILQSLSQEVREGLRMRHIKFRSDCG